MNFDRYCELFWESFPDEVVFACHLLEAAGQRFCVDFGYENAIDKASQILPRETVQ